MKIPSLLLLLLLATTAYAQSTISTPAVIPNPQSGFSDFNIVSHLFDINGETEQNHVVRLGHNCSEGGSPQVVGQASVCFEMERHYRPFGLNGPKWMETHLTGTNKTRTKAPRGFSFLFDEDTGSFTAIVQTDNLNFMDGNYVNRMQLASGYLIFMNGTAIRSIDNNADWLQQYNAAGNGVVPLIKADSTNTVVLGNSTFNARTGPLTVKDSITFNDLKLVRDDAHTLRLVDSAGGRGVLDISELKINGQTVLIAPCDNIVQSNGTLADTTRAINEVIDCFVHNKLIAQP